MFGTGGYWGYIIATSIWGFVFVSLFVFWVSDNHSPIITKLLIVGGGIPIALFGFYVFLFMGVEFTHMIHCVSMDTKEIPSIGILFQHISLSSKNDIFNTLIDGFFFKNIYASLFLASFSGGVMSYVVFVKSKLKNKCKMDRVNN